jgi:hypothetical protein
VDDLRFLGIGLIVVAVDLRFNGIDIATDAVGWLVALGSLLSLGKRHLGFRVSGIAAGIGLAAWAADPWLGVDRELAELVELVAQTTIVFATCTALMALVPAKASSANLIRWLDLGIGVVALLAIAALRDSAAAAALVIPLVVVGLGVFVAFLVLVFRCAEIDPQPVTHPVD